MLYKPRGVTSLAKSSVEGELSVIDLVPTALQHSTLGIYGRLDVDTTGLLLLGTDGGIGQLLTHPSSEIAKQYVATLNRDNGKWALCDNAGARFAEGLVLTDGNICRQAQLTQIPNTNESAEQVRVFLHEGKYHQVKKMIAAVGGYVKHLHRDWIGCLQLDERMLPGEVRELSDNELRLVYGMLPKHKRMLPRKPVAGREHSHSRPCGNIEDGAINAADTRSAKRVEPVITVSPSPPPPPLTQSSDDGSTSTSTSTATATEN
jgi:16S rRNA pseudouridine516 synthase